MAILISSCVTHLIHQAAAVAAPEEACGLLFGDDRAILRASVTANVAPDRHRQFEIDPAALFAALRAERAGGETLVGYWHSHPSGEAAPSVTDAAMAAPDGRLWLIVAGEGVTVWRAGTTGRHDRFEAVGIECEAKAPSLAASASVRQRVRSSPEHP